MAVGRNGEASAALWLQSQAADRAMPACFGNAEGDWAVHWDNKVEEGGQPWDVRCVSGARTVYVEVKATSRHDAQARGTFEISGPELVHAKAKGTDYFILRMCGVPVHRRSGALAAYFFVDPWSMLHQTDATLQMRVPIVGTGT
jgi:hypothetical protein